MTKTLVKKQLLEVFSWLFQNRKTGEMRDKKGIIIYSVIYAALFIFLGVIFYMIANALCNPLNEAGFSWLYIALMGIVGVMLGSFGSVFNTFSSLYQAKDNDLLLSMPISVKDVLIARLSGVYAMGLMYELLVMVPTVIVYFINVKVGIAAVICSVLIPFVLSIFILSLSCILGWIVAIVNSKLKRKNILTVIVSLVFIGAYYYICGSASTILQTLITQPQSVANKVKGVLYPLYHMGLAAKGNLVSMIIFTLIIFVIFSFVYIGLSVSFIRLATGNKGEIKVRYKEKSMKSTSPDRALFRKELQRFIHSSVYMLNCGLGIVFMLASSVIILIKQDAVNKILELPISGLEEIAVLISVASVCMMTTMNDISAPSVSLEGKNIWILQSFPVSAWKVLKAKVLLQVSLTVVPALIMVICVEWILKPAIVFLILVPTTVVLFILLMSLLGVVCNLKAPNLKWINEAVPIKMSLSVSIAMFGGWAIVLALAIIYYFIRKCIGTQTYLVLVNIIFMATNIILIMWLKKKGSIIFDKLGN